MQYTQLGTTGERVSRMCLGTMMFGGRCDEPEAARILAAALDHGVNFVDTAAMYCDGLTEEILGRIMAGQRDKLFIATKVHKGVDTESIRGSIDESLARLRTDYVDLYLIHWPRQGMDPATIMEALNDVVAQGKARYVGCCNYPAWLYAHSNALAERHGWPGLVCNQIPYNLVERGVEVEILPQAVAEQVAITVYRPLLIGILAGKYPAGAPVLADSRGASDPRIPAWLEKYGPALERFERFAAERGAHPAHVAIAWLRHSPAVTSVIAGVSALGQLPPLLEAFDFELSDPEYDEVTAMFGAAVVEEAGGAFPGLRRELRLLG